MNSTEAVEVAPVAADLVSHLARRRHHRHPAETLERIERFAPGVLDHRGTAAALLVELAELAAALPVGVEEGRRPRRRLDLACDARIEALQAGVAA